MDNRHCDELNQILYSPESIFERYGIATIAIILLLVTTIILSFNHLGNIKVASIAIVEVDNNILIKTTLDNPEKDLFLDNINNILFGDYKIECNTDEIGSIQNDASLVVYLRIKKNSDIRLIKNYLKEQGTRRIKVEYAISYFDIIIRPLLNLI